MPPSPSVGPGRAGLPGPAWPCTVFPRIRYVRKIQFVFTYNGRVPMGSKNRFSYSENYVNKPCVTRPSENYIFSAHTTRCLQPVRNVHRFWRAQYFCGCRAFKVFKTFPANAFYASALIVPDSLPNANGSERDA